MGFAAEQAEKYSPDLSGWVMAGKDRLWERGDWIGGPIPDGYHFDGDKSLALDPERAAVIRRIYKRALEAGAAASIARELNADGVRTRSGGAWTRRRVQDTRQRGLRGHARPLARHARRRAQAGRHPAIVSPEEFAAVADATGVRDRAAAGRALAGRPTRRFLPAGLARCARGGGTMYSRTLPPNAAQTYRERGRKRKTTIHFDYRVPNG